MRIGSAALALAYLACGRIDGFWSKGLFSWDLAGGLQLVKEACGKITGLAGKSYEFSEVHLIASNGLLHDDLISNLERL